MNGKGCLDGRVTGFNNVTGAAVYYAAYENGHVSGPRVGTVCRWEKVPRVTFTSPFVALLQWFLSHSEHEMALVGVLYHSQPPPPPSTATSKAVLPNVAPPFDFR